MFIFATQSPNNTNCLARLFLHRTSALKIKFREHACIYARQRCLPVPLAPFPRRQPRLLVRLATYQRKTSHAVSPGRELLSYLYFAIPPVNYHTDSFAFMRKVFKTFIILDTDTASNTPLSRIHFSVFDDYPSKRPTEPGEVELTGIVTPFN